VRTTLTTREEQRLAERAPVDAAAFHQLYQHYFPRIYAYVAYRVGPAQDAEDLTAEVFMKVVEGLGRFEYRGEGALTAWIFRIAHNQVSQFYRARGGGQPALSLDDLPDIESDLPGPDDALQRKERFERLQALIGTLSARRQEIITLRFFGELRNHEIAAVLQLDERTVASHLCRGLEDLRSRYDDETGGAVPTEKRDGDREQERHS
jgi:RNA polymerase sigma-70 factor, ECF subfamily